VELETPETAVCGASASQLHISGSFTLIKRHPQEINLCKVDSVWFLDIFVLRGMELHQATIHHQHKASDEGD